MNVMRFIMELHNWITAIMYPTTNFFLTIVFGWAIYKTSYPWAFSLLIISSSVSLFGTGALLILKMNPYFPSGLNDVWVSGTLIFFAISEYLALGFYVCGIVMLVRKLTNKTQRE